MHDVQPLDPRRGGFVVAVVVFVLFAVGLAGTAAYQIVRLEAELSGQGREGGVALSAASAGLERFVGEHHGFPPDSAPYVIGGASVVVRARKVTAVDSVTDLYHLRSEAQVADPRFSDAPARRIVHQYAHLHKDPVGIHAALLVAAGNVRVRQGGRVDGSDQANTGDCANAGRYDRIGIANTGNVSDQGGGTIAGRPDHVNFGSFRAISDSAGVRWDVLQSEDFSIRHDGEEPDWSQVPADSFPVVRATGDFSNSADWSGRGVLIVPGTFTLSRALNWDGIILAGRIGNLNQNNSRIRGLVIGGLDGQQGSVEIRHVDIRYNSCYALAASASLAYLVPLSNTWFEGT